MLHLNPEQIAESNYAPPTWGDVNYTMEERPNTFHGPKEPKIQYASGRTIEKAN